MTGLLLIVGALLRALRNMLCACVVAVRRRRRNRPQEPAITAPPPRVLDLEQVEGFRGRYTTDRTYDEQKAIKGRQRAIDRASARARLEAGVGRRASGPVIHLRKDA